MTQGLAATVCAATALAAVLALPVVRAPAERLFGIELVGRHPDPYTVIEQYAAWPAQPAVLQPATDWPGMALARLIDPVAAYNLLVLSSFVLAAAFAFAHGYHLIRSPAGAAVAALLFAFSPFHLAHAAYHVHIAQVQWIPLYFLFLWRMLERPSLSRTSAATLALLITGAASLYLGFIAAAITPIAALAYVSLADRVADRRQALGCAAAMLTATAAVTLVVTAVVAPDAWTTSSTRAFPSFSVEQHSARWWSYLMPPAAHPWWGDASRQFALAHGIREGLLEQQVSLGAAVIALAAIPLALGATGPGRRSFPARALAVTAAAALLFSLPPLAALLHDLAPVFRAHARFGVVVSLLVTTMAGAGVVMVARRWRRGGGIAAVVLVAAAAVEYAPAWPVARDALPTDAHRTFAGVAGVRVLDCVAPEDARTAGVSRLMGGNVMFSAGLIDDCAEPQLGIKLAALGVTHLLIRHEPGIAGWLSRGGQPDHTGIIRSWPDASVFRVVAAQPAVYVGTLDGFYPREYRGRDSWRWMAREGRLTIVNATGRVQTVWLDLELEAFAAERVLRATPPNRPSIALTVGPDRQWRRLGPFEALPGWTTLMVSSDGVASPAAEPRLGDARPLSVALGGWRVHTSNPSALEALR